MKTSDKVLWERELAEHLCLHPDLRHLPPPVFPRWSRTRYPLTALTLVFVTVLTSAITGWWIGLYLI